LLIHSPFAFGTAANIGFFDLRRATRAPAQRRWGFQRIAASLPCKGGIQPLKGRALADLSAKLRHDWKVVNKHHLEKQFTFKDFK